MTSTLDAPALQGGADRFGELPGPIGLLITRAVVEAHEGHHRHRSMKNRDEPPGIGVKQYWGLHCLPGRRSVQFAQAYTPHPGWPLQTRRQMRFPR